MCSHIHCKWDFHFSFCRTTTTATGVPRPSACACFGRSWRCGSSSSQSLSQPAHCWQHLQLVSLGQCWVGLATPSSTSQSTNCTHSLLTCQAFPATDGAFVAAVIVASSGSICAMIFVLCLHLHSISILLSSNRYREHLLQHHMFTNTPLDNHFLGTEPFLRTDPTKERAFLQKYLTPHINFVLISFGAAANYIAHTVELIKGHEEFHIGKLFLPLQVAAHIYLFGLWPGTRHCVAFVRASVSTSIPQLCLPPFAPYISVVFRCIHSLTTTRPCF